MRNFISALLIGLLCMGSTAMAREAVDPVVTASLAAQEQLVKIDAGNYSLEEGFATVFTALVTEETWAKQMGAVREPLGSVISRTVLKGESLTSLPGMPDGNYIILQFNTQFENKKESVETVTMIFENEEWRLGGYFIK